MARHFDAIVIGSGLGGLTAGALHARAGHRVLVLERNSHFGGAATVYRHSLTASQRMAHFPPEAAGAARAARQQSSNSDDQSAV